MNYHENYYKKYKYRTYDYKYLSQNMFINEVPVSSEYGFIELHITQNLGKEVAEGALTASFFYNLNRIIPGG